jgi:hypothetical protein
MVLREEPGMLIFVSIAHPSLVYYVTTKSSIYIPGLENGKQRVQNQLKDFAPAVANHDFTKGMFQ